jgi:hypothetical protein
METLRYYFEDGTLVIFDKYTIDTFGVIRNKKTEKMMSIRKVKAGYNTVGVVDKYGKQRSLLIGRAIASTFVGPPPTLEHTADHKNKKRDGDTLDNIRWLGKKGQRENQTRSETRKSAFIVVKDGVEKTAHEWVEYLIEHNSFGRKYNLGMIRDYAKKKQHGFSYKKYPDLPGEIWKEIAGSKTKLGRWEISDMNRVKFITTHAENVLSGERIGINGGGYPTIRMGQCHILSFITFFPKQYAEKNQEEIIKHIGDNKLDFRPHMLQLGTHSENVQEAHDNGKYDGTKKARVKCASYIDGVFEKEHDSQETAAKYLKMLDYKKADQSNIGKALRSFIKGKILTRYGRTWQTI